jgi:hypothetical protein
LFFIAGQHRPQPDFLGQFGADQSETRARGRPQPGRFGGLLPIVGSIAAVAAFFAVALIVKDPVLGFLGELFRSGPGALEDIFRALFGG